MNIFFLLCTFVCVLQASDIDCAYTYGELPNEIKLRILSSGKDEPFMVAQRLAKMSITNKNNTLMRQEDILEYCFSATGTRFLSSVLIFGSHNCQSVLEKARLNLEDICLKATEGMLASEKNAKHLFSVWAYRPAYEIIKKKALISQSPQAQSAYEKLKSLSGLHNNAAIQLDKVISGSAGDTMSVFQARPYFSSHLGKFLWCWNDWVTRDYQDLDRYAYPRDIDVTRLNQSFLIGDTKSQIYLLRLFNVRDYLSMSTNNVTSNKNEESEFKLIHMPIGKGMLFVPTMKLKDQASMVKESYRMKTFDLLDAQVYQNTLFAHGIFNGLSTMDKKDKKFSILLMVDLDELEAKKTNNGRISSVNAKRVLSAEIEKDEDVCCMAIDDRTEKIVIGSPGRVVCDYQIINKEGSSESKDPLIATS